MQQFKTKIISKQKLKEFMELGLYWNDDWKEMNRVLLMLFKDDLKELKKHVFFPKTFAQQTATRAIKTGKLKRLPCRDCGTEEKIHAHHPDYNKPLKIIWLCASCHPKEHSKLRKNSN